MSYQVLARKWRPRVFREMVGQEHVLQALINALDHNRLHHAYLFTGTRGVGKTTIARILAKCLNCETGVSSEPCGQCASCREIAEGRFVDLIEVDAASRTKVEDTRDLLENVQYAPTRGRYKVYLIDEVHMLSNSSFNALLKTLEEPPPHVKFLLATTDPQKLPMTILSRCLQFNLKNMNPERIVKHLQFVLEKELVPFEERALWHLGRAADGSMRDAMSLTDQAIAYGSGKITEAEVSTMLGTIDQAAVYDIVTALASLDGRELLAAVERMSEQAPDYASALGEMLSMLHRIAIAQALPEAVDNSHGDRERIMQLAQQIPSEDVQLFYQTALLGRRDLPLAPDPRAGFEMVLLRMLAFKPQGVIDVPNQSLPQPTGPKVVPVSAPQIASQASPAPSEPSPSASSPAVATVPTSSTLVSPQESASSQVPVEPPAAPAATLPSAQELATATPSAPTVAPIVPVPSPQSIVSMQPAAPQSAIEKPPFDGPYDNAPSHGEAATYNEAPSYAADYEEVPDGEYEDDYTPASAYYQAPTAAEPQTLNTAGDLEPKKSEAAQPPIAVAEAEQLERLQPIMTEALSVPINNAPINNVPSKKSLRKVLYEEAAPQDWLEIYLGLGVTGILQSTIANCQMIGRQGNEFQFVLDDTNSTLYDVSHQQRLEALLTDYFVERVSVKIQVGVVSAETPAKMAVRLKEERQKDAEQAIKHDPIVQQLMAQFGATLREDTIQPIN